MIEIVSATRKTKSLFASTLLGRSLERLKFDARISSTITYNNSKGLPEIYNSAISSNNDTDILIFIHDDVWIDDYFLGTRVIEGLKHFDIIGVAGNKRILPNHIGWVFKGPSPQWDHPNLRGAVGHGSSSFSQVTHFGPSPDSCQLIDGLFIASKKETLRNSVQFDPQFPFHFYDLDFCRSAQENGLSIGVWPIALTHASSGNFGSPQWQKSLHAYRAKWA